MSDASFPRTSRLTQKAQFENVLRRPQLHFSSGPLRLKACQNRIGVPRLGIIVAKRVVRRAVDRNRAKRIIRNSFRLAKSGLPALDVVVQVRGRGSLAGAADALWSQMLAEAAAVVESPTVEN